MNRDLPESSGAVEGLPSVPSVKSGMAAHGALPVQCLHANAQVPTRAHADDAGLDLYGLESVTIGAREGKLLRTGVAVALPQGTVGMIADRSSLAKKGLKTAGGIIDAGYRGEIMVMIWNLTDAEQRLAAGDRIAQMLVIPIQTPAPHAVANLSELGETKRGSGGFGSTGN